MNYVKSLNVIGVEAKEIPCILDTGAPTTTTEGAVGLLYMDENTGDLYKCTAAQVGVYTWEKLVPESSKVDISKSNGVTTISVTDKEETQTVKISDGETLKGTASSAAVRVDDVSPIEHTVACKVKSKNLFNNTDDFYLAAGATHTYDGATLTINGYYTSKIMSLEEEKTYTLSFKSTRTGNTGGGIYIAASPYVLYSGASILSNTVTFTVPKGHGSVQFTFYGGNTVSATTSATYTEIMLEEGTGATGYVAYVDVTAATVRKCGKNILPAKTAENGTTKGITYTNNGKGIITVNGTATGAAYVPVDTSLFLPAGKYILSQQGDEISPSYLYITGASGYTPVQNNGSKVFTSTGGVCQIYVYVAEGTAIENKTIKVMLEAGETKSGFEAPIESQIATARADGTVEGITSLSPVMTLLTDTANTVIECEYNRDINTLTKAVPLIDRVTGIPYYLYVSDGKLYIEEREG